MNTLEERAQAAYMAGNNELHDALCELIDAKEEITRLNTQIADTETLADWEEKNGSAYEYVQFFRDCFNSLTAHYPYPDITSEHDKLVIFDAIRKGDGIDD